MTGHILLGLEVLTVRDVSRQTEHAGTVGGQAVHTGTGGRQAEHTGTGCRLAVHTGTGGSWRCGPAHCCHWRCGWCIWVHEGWEWWTLVCHWDRVFMCSLLLELLRNL